MKRKLMLIGGGILSIFILGEIILRVWLGMCNAPLYQKSGSYEYIAAPNQSGKRFGNRYHYNSFSQRSEEPDSTKTIVLGLGDSVIFGGVMIDQDNIATSIFSRETGMQMLNISAGSWGPDNCAAYLKENGLFGAKAMFLLVSSHDAFDNMNFQPVVGVSPSYPDQQYLSAWAELISRYIWPRTIGKIFAHKNENDPDKKVLDGIGIHKNGNVFNPGFNQLKAIADSADIPLYVCLHADIKELEESKYNEQGSMIIDWCKKNDVPCILEIKEGLEKDMFRDGIHTNEKGQRFEAGLMKKYIRIKKENLHPASPRG